MMEALIREKLNAMSSPVQLETVARFSPIRLMQKVFWRVEMLSRGSDSPGIQKARTPHDCPQESPPLWRSNLNEFLRVREKNVLLL